MLTVKQIYELAIKKGIENDPRGPKRVRALLGQAKVKFDKLSIAKKKEFDRESLVNPYSDTRFFAKNPNREVRRVLVGIDIDVAEVLLAKQLTDSGQPIDLVMSHHPVGDALASLSEVMHMQAEIMALYGVPINVAENLLKKRMSEVSRRLSPINHYQPVDAARLLDVPVMCTHTVTDNCVMTYLKDYFEKREKKVEYVSDVLEMLNNFPEYEEAKRRKQGPVLFSGSPDRFAGRVAFTELTGGTEGAQEMYEKLSQAGVGTLVAMHMSEERKEEADKHHMNVIVAGHMSSDSLGMNLFLDELEKRGVEIVATGGLIRVPRIKGKRSSPSRKASATKRRTPRKRTK